MSRSSRVASALGLAAIVRYALAAPFLDLAVPPKSSRSESDIPDFVCAGEPEYNRTSRELAGILTCPEALSATSKPVLLVHGTGSTGEESFQDGYVPALQRLGYSPCWVDLPERALEDIQVSAAYVAYNMHYVAFLAGNQTTAVIGHSQGNIDIYWALKFWPSTRQAVRAYIGLSPDLHGVTFQGSDSNATYPCQASTRNTLDTTSICQPAQWQQQNGSRLIHAMRYRDFGAKVPTTLIWSGTDTVARPPQLNAELPGATSISVQQLCPGRKTDHFSMLLDAAGFAIASDALAHGGLGNVERARAASPDACDEYAAPGMSAMAWSLPVGVAKDFFFGSVLTQPRVTSEPALKAYAQPPNQGGA